MAPTTFPRARAVDRPLSAADEELLSALVDELSNELGSGSQAALERLAAAHPSSYQSPRCRPRRSPATGGVFRPPARSGGKIVRRHRRLLTVRET